MDGEARAYRLTWPDGGSHVSREKDFQQSNADDAQMCAELAATPVGGSQQYGGGAAPLVTITVFASEAEALAAEGATR